METNIVELQPMTSLSLIFVIMTTTATIIIITSPSVSLPRFHTRPVSATAEGV